MTRVDRVLVLLYALHALWSAWCATQQYLYGNTPAALIFLLLSLLPLAAIVAQNDLADARDAPRYYEAREARSRSSQQQGAPATEDQARRDRPTRRTGEGTEAK
ncbi:hypothetical protein FNH09_08345 [Streptomyces adustus]|uniref:Uncharacterized protein n=1 Tax=Streptomyces adustus TaxID=1609272 RepID=A0A5N8V887_9ACTN|nr:hypothetical protein [Streptomyces adustus]MPY31309.1 hypothetical protein [Streptomyces adustus]